MTIGANFNLIEPVELKIMFRGVRKANKYYQPGLYVSRTACHIFVLHSIFCVNTLIIFYYINIFWFLFDHM